MKRQIKFQKWLTLISLVSGVAAFAYALAFCTGNLANLSYYNSQNNDGEMTLADTLNACVQTYNTAFAVVGVLLIVAVAALYLFACHKRRNYYLSNYVVVGLYLAANVAAVIVFAVGLSVIVYQYAILDWQTLLTYSRLELEVGGPALRQGDYTVIIIGYVLTVALFANGLAWLYNAVWKTKLMQGERLLLSGAVSPKEGGYEQLSKAKQ